MRSENRAEEPHEPSERAPQLLLAHGVLFDACFISDGRKVVLHNEFDDVLLWNVDEGDRLRSLTRDPGRVRGLRLGPDDRLAVVTEEGEVAVWDLEAGTRSSVLRTASATTDTVAPSADGRFALTTDRAPASVMRPWDVATGECVRTFAVPENAHRQERILRFTPKGCFALTGGSDAAIRIWDLRSGRCLAELTGHVEAVMDFAVAREGHHVLSSSLDGTLRLWELDWDLAAPQGPA